METIMQSSQEHQAMTEDSSDRSDESSIMSQEYQTRGFEDYEIVRRLKGSVGELCSARNDSHARSKTDFRRSVEGSLDSNEQHQKVLSPLEGIHSRDLSLNLGKSKKYDYSSVQLGNVMNYQMERINETEVPTETSQICRSKEPTMKEALFNLQSAREKYLAASFDRSPKEFNYLVERDAKEHSVAKDYNLTVDRKNELNMSHERSRENQGNTSPNVERLSAVGILDVRDHHRSHLHGQSLAPQDIECIVYERLRRPHHHFLNRMDFTGQSLTGSQHAQQSSTTPIPQTHQQDQQQQQQQQRQIKSFTIDAILAHKNNQRSYQRYQRSQQQQMRKTARASREECTSQEATGKNGLRARRAPIAGVNGVSRIVSSGKAKRVRTIFTAEQLERLESEFARQQYMVGPERLYLAHALGLTEAQVKVWFQNRRIKWRKVNHERQCQAVSEHRQRCTLPGALEIHEDESNDTSNVNWCVSSAITTSPPADDSTLINAAKQHQR